MSNQAFLVAALRTPIGKLGGAFAGISASDLGATVITGLLDETGIEPRAVSEVILGQVLTGGAGQNPARQAALKGGLPVDVPAMTINKVCGAGQKSIHLAAQAIRCGDADIVIAGGQDSMTQAPHFLYGVRSGIRIGHSVARDSMLVDGLIDAFHDVHMGVTVEALASRYQITRSDQDAFALESQRRAKQAIESKKFGKEMVTVLTQNPKGPRFVVADEHPNPNVTRENLARLKPAFDPSGSITAGNSSGVNDGAAAVVVMSEREVQARRLTPLARIASYASAGVEPMEMGLGPVAASRNALAKAGWVDTDLDLMEVNEAFAAQSLAVNRELNWDPDRINVNGGAIALGHPLAGSGCRVVVTLVHEMVRRGARKGLATLCIGGGMGVAICLER